MGDMFSEPEQQNQNPCKRCIQDIKKLVESLMDHTGTPAKYWLLCLMFNMYLFNRLALNQLDGKTLFEKSHAYKPDISAFLAFCWWEPVYACALERHFLRKVVKNSADGLKLLKTPMMFLPTCS
jgi:hypothetical protein